ncbi:MAG: DUF7619 domain-containing protein, partial [bacterium]
IGAIGAPTGPFSVVTDNCSNQTLGFFALCLMNLQFTPPTSPPNTGGAYSGTLSIPSNDPDENPYVVNLTGVGVAPPILLAPPNDVYASERPTFRLRANAPGVSVLHFIIEISTNNFASIYAQYNQMLNPDGWSKTQYTSGEDAEFTIPVGQGLPSGDYQWRAQVHYHNESVYSDYSEIRTFRVPAAPTLLTPEYGATTGSKPAFTMTWNNPGTPTTLHYILEILDLAFNVLRTYDQRTSGVGWSQPQYAPGETASFTVPAASPLPEGTYYWRARVHLNDFGALSPASNARQFDVALPKITSVSPPDAFINGAIQTLNIFGDDFQSGANTRLVCTDCAEPALGDIQGTVLQGSNTFLQVEFDLIRDAIVGGYDLVVTNPDGEEARLHVLIQPLISFPWIEPGGVQGIAIVPITFPHGGTNLTCLMVYNFSNSYDNGYFLMEINPPAPGVVRFRVGYDHQFPDSGGESGWESMTADDKTKAMVLFPAGPWPTCLPIGLGVDPEKVIFPQGFVPSTSHDFVIFGEGAQLTWKGVGSAGKDAVKGMIVDTLIAAGCAFVGDLLTNDPNYTNLKKAVSDVVDGLPQGIGATPEYVLEEAAKKVAELVPGVSVAIKVGNCLRIITEALVNAWRSMVKGAADRIRGRTGGDPLDAYLEAHVEAGHKAGNSAYSGLASLVMRNEIQNKPPCNPPPTHSGGGSYTVQGPWDPNDKLTNSPYPCERIDVGGTPQCARYFIPMANAGDANEYVIRFENKAQATGPAVNVVITTDVLDSDLDPTTLEMVITSHEAVFQTPEVSGQTVIFRFNDINLPPNVNAPEGEGFVQFRVKPRAGLPAGTEIRNMASIVFDFNPPIVTPEVVHIVGQGALTTTRGPATIPTTAQKGATDVAMLQFVLTSGPSEGLKVESFTLTASGNGNDVLDVMLVKVYLDANGNGRFDTGETMLGNGQYSADNGTWVYTFVPSRMIATGQSETWLVAYDFAQAIARSPAPARNKPWDRGRTGFVIVSMLALSVFGLRRRKGLAGAIARVEYRPVLGVWRRRRRGPGDYPHVPGFAECAVCERRVFRRACTRFRPRCLSAKITADFHFPADCRSLVAIRALC